MKNCNITNTDFKYTIYHFSDEDHAGYQYQYSLSTCLSWAGYYIKTVTPLRQRKFNLIPDIFMSKTDVLKKHSVIIQSSTHHASNQFTKGAFPIVNAGGELNYFPDTVKDISFMTPP
jgi:hypothetical protein